MAVCKMQRMNIFGLQEDRKAILERLQAWGVMEVNIPETGDGLTTMDTTATRQRYERRAQALQQALETLDRYAPEHKSMFASLAGKDLIGKDDYTEICARRHEIVAAAQQVLNREKEIGEHKAAISRLENQLEGLEPWMGLDVPMNFRGTASASLLLGTIPGSWMPDTLMEAIGAATPELTAQDVTILSIGRDYAYIAVLCLRDDAPALEEALRSIGFARPSQLSDKTPAEAQADLLVQREEEEKKIADLEAELQEQGSCRRDFRILSDYFRIRADKYEVLGQLPQSSRTFLVSGYVPAGQAKKLAADLTDHYRAAVEIEELPEDEEAPVLLQNNAVGGMAEGIVRSFGMPGKGEIDPSFLTSLFFIFFFGLMLSDAAYGFLLALVCGIVLIKFPRMSPGLRKNMQIFFWGGISTLFWGVMFGGYFGDLVNVVSRVFFGKEISIPPLWFTPLNDPTRLLMYSMLFGLVHLFVGLGIKGYMCLRDKDIMSFIFNVLCWYLMLIGLILMLLPTDLFYGISQMAFHFPPALQTASKIMAIVGAVGILLMSARDHKNPILRILMGAYDLYNITGWLSDVLSYSRLLALGLATGVIAQVVNQMGSMFGGSVLGVIIFIVVFVVGHTLNIAINLLGAYVHTCRLQYVEFYGKFYESGGREFEPFHQNTTFVDIKEEI